MKKNILVIPFVIFISVLFIFFYLLIAGRNPSELPSVLLNKMVPAFETESLLNKKIFISKNEFGDEVILVNFFATWCGPCRDEHAYMKKLSRNEKIRIIGINYKDNQNKAIKWLKELGNPYSDVILDIKGNIGIEWGVYGIPETFIVNSNSKIKYRLAGPITDKNYDSFILKIKESKK